MRLSRLISFWLVIACALGVRAQLSEQTVTATGHGRTAEAARRAALVEVVRQANEVLVSSEQKTDSSTVDTGEIKSRSITLNGGDKSKDVIENRASFSELTSENIGVTTRGVISRYRILSETKEDDGQFSCELEAICPTYSSPSKEREHLRAIAVEPFALAPSIGVQKDGLKSAEMADILAQAISEKLTQSRKFRVLDRRYGDSVSREEKVMREKGPLKELARFGKTVGADYLLVGTIREYSAKWIEHKISLLNTSEWDYSGSYVIEYRLIETATSEIRMSHTLELRGGQELLAGVGAADPEHPYSALARVMGARVSDELLENVYPVMVIAVSGPSAIYLNQGGERFRPGDELLLFQPQKSVPDPATDTEIRIDGAEIGRIKINGVRTKFSIAQLQAGDIKAVQIGCLARPSAPPETPAPEPPKPRSGSKFK